MSDQKYKCKYCGKTVERKSNKEWIKSYCVSSERLVHLLKTKIEKTEKTEKIEGRKT
jgi:transposase-like protein